MNKDKFEGGVRSAVEAFVAGEIIHDHRIALAQLRDEDLLDVGLEGDAVDRAVQDERRDEAAQRQAPTNVVVFQWPCGTPTAGVRPRRQRR